MIEVTGNDLRPIRSALAALPVVRSIAQLGNRLHLLIRPAQESAANAALGLIRRTLSDAGIEATAEEAGAGLEDVFVAATGND